MTGYLTHLLSSFHKGCICLDSEAVFWNLDNHGEIIWNCLGRLKSYDQHQTFYALGFMLFHWFPTKILSETDKSNVYVILF